MTTRRSRRPARGGRRPVATAAVQPAPRAAVRPVLVASDGSRPASAAFRFAQRMAGRGLWAPDVLTLTEPMSGSVAECAGAAAARDADLLVIGLGPHRPLGRASDAEAAARLTRLSRLPVLAVDASGRARHRVALVAMDFGDSSVSAAREARSLLEEPGRLHLLHVRWAVNGRTVGDPEWERSYAAGVEQGFRRVRAELGDRPGVEITCEMRCGPVIETVLAVADAIGADLLAAGSHNQSMLDRLVIGSTPTQLLRGATCSVLIAPPGESA